MVRSKNECLKAVKTLISLELYAKALHMKSDLLSETMHRTRMTDGCRLEVITVTKMIGNVLLSIKKHMVASNEIILQTIAMLDMMTGHGIETKTDIETNMTETIETFQGKE